MKSILICPSQRPAVAFLGESMPLVSVPILGESLVGYWLEHLFREGARDIRISATDRPDQLRALLDGGAKWGVKLQVFPEMREHKPEEARRLYRPPAETDWPPEPSDVVLLDRFPKSTRNMFSSYAAWFSAALECIPNVQHSLRIGLRELKPGVWVGWRSQISPSAQLRGPCWIGENVRVGSNAIIGPNAILENCVVADQACEIKESWVGPETFVGSLTHLNESLAWGSTLIKWRNGSCINVPDAFLLSSLAQKGRPAHGGALPAGLASRLYSTISRPIGALFGQGKITGLTSYQGVPHETSGRQPD